MSSIKIRTRRQADYTEIKLLIDHPMENGRNRNPSSGDLIPAHFIERLIIEHNDVVVIDINMAGSISKNPFFSFRLKTVASGDKISAGWIDNRQQSDRLEHIVS